VKKLIGVFVMLALCVWQITPAMADNSALSKQLDHLLSNTFKQNKPGAAVLVAKGDEIILHRAYGMANLEHQIPLTIDMHFRIASLTKQFTTMAVLKLEQQGKLSFSDPVTKYLPGYTTAGHTVTIEQLATNTSGIPDFTTFDGFEAVEKKHTSLERLIAYFSDKPFEFSPGDENRYSSSNFVLLGKVIEVVSGQSYMEYLSSVFLKPLGMRNTHYGSVSKVLPGRVQGYEKHNDEFINAPHLSMTVPHAAGALRSTTMDLYRWQRALVKGELFSESLLSRAWSQKQLNNGTLSNYGYGWNIGELDGEKTVAHSGGIKGFSAFSVLLPDKDIHVIMLSNLASVRLPPLAAKLIQIVQGKAAAPSKLSVPDNLLTRLPGDYYFSDIGFSMKITENERKLLMSHSFSDKSVPLHYDGKGGVYYDDVWTRFLPVSNRDAQGDIIMQYWYGERFYAEAE
jgi:CubicO group peptidase (beta-lactamase class C family)